MDTQQVTLYASNTDITSTEYPTKAAVEALSPASKVFNATWTRGGVKMVDKTIQHLNGFVMGQRILRLTWEPESEPLDLPSAETDIVSYFGLDVVQKKYKWLYIPEYTIKPAALFGTNCVAVQIVGGMTITFGYKRKFKLKLAKRSVGV